MWTTRLSWPVLKDVVLVAKDLALTGFGMWVAATQISRPHDSLILLALVLTGSNAAGHAAALLSGPGPGLSSSRSSSSGSLSSSPQPSGTTGDVAERTVP